jgi:hypothetical protein
MDKAAIEGFMDVLPEIVLRRAGLREGHDLSALKTNESVRSCSFLCVSGDVYALKILNCNEQLITEVLAGLLHSSNNLFL